VQRCQLDPEANNGRGFGCPDRRHRLADLSAASSPARATTGIAEAASNAGPAVRTSRRVVTKPPETGATPPRATPAGGRRRARRGGAGSNSGVAGVPGRHSELASGTEQLRFRRCRRATQHEPRGGSFPEAGTALREPPGGQELSGLPGASPHS
jgi:hypothetical protein